MPNSPSSTGVPACSPPRLRLRSWPANDLRMGPTDKGDVAMVEEARAEMCRAVRLPRDLAATAQIDPAQHEGAAVLVFEVGTFDADQMLLRQAVANVAGRSRRDRSREDLGSPPS